MHHTIVVK